MVNLIAYIPVLNRQYLQWLERHQPFCLYLVTEDQAASLIPRLSRNLGALSAYAVLDLLLGVRAYRFPESSVNILNPDGDYPCLQRGDRKEWVMPDEDITRLIAEKLLYPANCRVKFEQIWGRWDMTAVKRQEPVIPDVEVSSIKIDQLRMEAARKLARKSPDWWRQIAALAFRDEELIAASYNLHHPTEYETALFGDPRINFDAGDSAGAEVYLSLHAEKGVIGACARDGIKLKGASVYVTTFPCGDCARYLAETRIKELFFSDGYSVLGGLRTLQAAGVRIVQIKDPESA